MLQWGRLCLNLTEVPWRDRIESPLRFETGTECHDHPRELVGRSRQNCLNNMADGAIYGRKLDLTHTLGTFAWVVETFLSEKRSIQSKLRVKLANVSNERDSMALISITRVYEGKLKSRKWKITCNREWILFSQADHKRNNYAIQTRKLN